MRSEQRRQTNHSSYMIHNIILQVEKSYIFKTKTYFIFINCKLRDNGASGIHQNNIYKKKNNLLLNTKL